MVHNTQLLDVGFDSVCIFRNLAHMEYCLPIAGCSYPLGTVAAGGFRDKINNFPNVFQFWNMVPKQNIFYQYNHIPFDLKINRYSFIGAYINTINKNFKGQNIQNNFPKFCLKTNLFFQKFV